MIGEILKKSREESGLALSDIAQKLRIRIEHLQALEGNDFEKLPAEVFTIGYIREYARLLNLDSDPLVETFKGLKQEKTVPVEAAAEIIAGTSAETHSENKTTISPGIKIFAAIGAGAIAALILFAVMEGLKNTKNEITDNRIVVKLTKNIPAETPVVPAQKLPEQTEAKPSEVQKNIPPPVNNTSVKAPEKSPEQIKSTAPTVRNNASPVTNERRHKLKIIANENTWLRIETGAGEGQEVVMSAGESNEWSSRKGFNIKIGNAGGVKLVLNGKDLGIPGEKGQVLQLRLPKEEPRPQ